MILGLDSAIARTGWALIDQQGVKLSLAASGHLEHVGWRVVRDFVAKMVFNQVPIELVAIEDAYLGENVDTLKRLSRLVGRWQQEFEVEDFRTQLVLADRWQMGLLRGLIPHRASRQARKAAAVTWVHAQYGLVLEDDEADAACLATWVARERGVRQRSRGGTE